MPVKHPSSLDELGLISSFVNGPIPERGESNKSMDQYANDEQILKLQRSDS